MPTAEWCEMAGQAALVDHTHAAPHMLVVLDGEIHEDGCVYRAGDIRISTASDRHFLKFARTSRCLIVEGDVPDVPFGTRRVVRTPDLGARFQAVAEAGRAIELAGCRDLRDAAALFRPPSWLIELESRRTDGEFVRAMNLARVARIAGVSREHLARSYQQHFGTSVTGAIRARRLREAYDAITSSSEPLADIADGCGFADQSHMTRQFRQWIGRTPGELRRTSGITLVQDAARPVLL